MVDSFVMPLDLKYIFVNVLAGSMEIFMFLAMIFIAMIAGYFRMMSSTMIVLYILFAILMGQFMSGIYLLVVLIGGLVSFYLLSKIIK